MFKRIIYDGWTEIVPQISFWLTFGVFIAITLRALFLKRETVNHLANLPLEEEATQTHQSNNS